MTDNAPQEYFVLVYNVPHMHVEVHSFKEDRELAVAQYAALEGQYRLDDETEVVIVGADSIETIHKTHSHYFATAAEDLLDQFLTELQTSK